MSDMADLTKSHGGSKVRFVSWNVKGLNSPIKRGRIFAYLKKLKSEIIYLQETHLCIVDHLRIRKPWVGQVFHSNFNSKARGTAILIHKSIQFTASASIADPQGRYVIVSGILYNVPVLLVNVYAPNWDDVSFINKLVSLLPDLNSHLVIFGGDINCVMDPSLDRSNPKSSSRSKMAQALSTFIEQVGAVDPWRFQFPHSKEYSYFSHVHHSYSRIDYFFIDKSLLPSVGQIEYLPIVESDHAPLQLDLICNLRYNERPLWRLNTALLPDPTFCTFLSTAIDNFLLHNRSESIAASTLWETLNVVIRGEIISYTSTLNKKRKQKLDNLIDSIRRVDYLNSTSPSPELYKERLNLQVQYNLLSTNKTEWYLSRSKGYIYEHGRSTSSPPVKI